MKRYILLTISFLAISFLSLGQGNGKNKNKSDSTDVNNTYSAAALLPGGGGGTPPATPPNPTASTNTCGDKTITRSGTPPSGVFWFWQTSASGTVQGDGAATKTASSTGTFYLRAYELSTNLWSTGSGSVYVTVNPTPSQPSAPTISSNTCGNKTLTRGTPPSGVTWYWQGTNGSGTSTANSSLTYSVSSSSMYYIRPRSSAGCWGTTRGISVTVNQYPSTPSTPTASTNTCGNKILSRVAPPSGTTWYWHTSPTGTSTTYSGTSYTVSSSGTYYLRARTSAGCWSTNSSSITVTVNPYPSTPGTPTASTNTCGNKVLSRGTPPSGTTWYWHNSPTGTGTSQSGTTYSVSSSGTYYLRARTSAGCWSSNSSSVTVTVNDYPSTPSTPTASTNTCGNKTLTRGTPPSGTTWYWHTSPTGTSTTNSGSTYNVSSSGTYYLRALSSAGCWSANSSSVAVTINDYPTAPDVPSVSSNTCGDKTLTRGTPPVGFTWYWQGTNSNGTSTANSSVTYSAPSSNTYYIRAQNNATGCWSTSSTAVLVSINELPAAPGSPTATNFFDRTLLTQGTAPNGITWYWHTTTNSTDISNNLKTYETRENTTLYLRGKSDAGCWGSDKLVSVTVVPAPVVQVTGSHLLTTGQSSATLSCSGTYDSYTWKKEGVTVGTASSLVVSSAGSYTLTVTKTGVANPYTTNEEVFNELVDGQPMNWVETNSVLVEGVTLTTGVAGLPVGEKTAAKTYLGGLGNTLQTITWKSNPDQQNMVVSTNYDAFGRQLNGYLPFVVSDANIQFHSGAVLNTYTSSEQYAYYQQPGIGITNDTAPFSTTEVETSPLQRVLSTTGVGASWHSQQKSKHLQYNLNVTADNVRLWQVNGTGMPVSTGTYVQGELTRSGITDEDGNQAYVFADKLGRTVLKKVQVDATTWAKTYYVYDNMGRQRYVLPPELVKWMENNANYSPGQATLDLWAFQYRYGVYGRLTESKKPGAGWEYAIYDDRGRTVMTQNAQLRAANQWVFTKYDAYNRSVLTGVYTNTTETTRSEIQLLVDNFYSGGGNWFEEPGTAVHGYTNQSFPNVSDANAYLTVVYYDNYDFASSWGATYNYDNSQLGCITTAAQYCYPANHNTFVTGLTTGGMVKEMDSGTWLKTVIYYDDTYRPVQSVAANHIGGYDRTSVLYDFAGQVLQTKSYHTSATDTTQLATRYVYDHAGRLNDTYRQVNNETEVRTQNVVYNPLGQLIEKNLHEETGGYAQSVDVAYNIRGWLTGINNTNLDNDANDTHTDLFGMQLQYEDATNAHYNGAIGATAWNNAGENTVAAYDYTYDGLNRLTAADFTATGTSTTGFDMSAAYDLNGNITQLNRNERTAGLDALSFTYTGNRLDAVEDSSGNDKGFTDGNTGSTDYFYDTSGNLVQDKNKGIDTVVYNFMNLPVEITFSSGARITNAYSAAGQKLTQTRYATDGTTVLETTDYNGAYQYTNDTLQFIQTGEGRIIPGPVPGSPEYQYYLTDHLGNVRTVFTTKPTTDEYVATMETENIGNGMEDLFTQLNETRATSTAANHTAGGNEAAELDDTKPVGPGIIIPVFPGDTLDLEVWGYYEGGSGYNTATPAGMVASIADAFGGQNGAGGEAGAIYNGLSSALAALGFGGTNDDTRPAAYLNYIVLDENYAYVSDNAFGYVQIPANASFSQQQMTIPNILIDKVGYIFVYVSYESDVHNRVYFDDLKVTHHQSAVIQSNNYYPYGLQQSTSWTRSTLRKNNRLFNGGSELNEQTNLYETAFRSYDAAIGRFTGIDAIAGRAPSLTPYRFGGNNPISYNDPTGLYEYGLIENLNEGLGEYGARGGGNWDGGYAGLINWYKGITQFSDWSAWGGSDNYRKAKSVGASDKGGVLYWEDGTVVEERFGEVMVPTHVTRYVLKNGGKRVIRSVRNELITLDEAISFGLLLADQNGGGDPDDLPSIMKYKNGETVTVNGNDYVLHDNKWLRLESKERWEKRKNMKGRRRPIMPRDAAAIQSYDMKYVNSQALWSGVIGGVAGGVEMIIRKSLLISPFSLGYYIQDTFDVYQDMIDRMNQHDKAVDYIRNNKND